MANRIRGGRGEAGQCSGVARIQGAREDSPGPSKKPSPDNAGQQPSEGQGQARHDIGRRGQELAEAKGKKGVAHSTGAGQQTQRDKFERKRAARSLGESGELADAKGIRGQRLRPSGEQKPTPHGKAQLFMR